MVAYNFKSAFHGSIIAGSKRQTVRHAGGKRHARPGEAVQIYTGLRTKNARKLIPDPVCVGLDVITIPVDRHAECCVGQIEINGVPLSDVQAQDFALADGFSGLKAFGRFWLATHGEGRFEGVVIRWKQSDG